MNDTHTLNDALKKALEEDFKRFFACPAAAPPSKKVRRDSKKVNLIVQKLSSDPILGRTNLKKFHVRKVRERYEYRPYMGADKIQAYSDAYLHTIVVGIDCWRNLTKNDMASFPIEVFKGRKKLYQKYIICPEEEI